MKTYNLFIENQWVEPEGGDYFEAYNPATGEPIARFATATKGDVRKACAAARKAFPMWRDMDSNDRAEILLRVSEGILRREAEFAEMESRDAGKPIAETKGFDIRFSAYSFEYFAGICREVRSDVIPVKNGLKRGLFDFTTYEPYGVVAVISPFNYPLHLLTRSLAPALAAGNTCVCKASSMTPVTTAMLAEVMEEAGMPAGVINIISGAGSLCGEALASDEDVDVIAFTGSESVGRRLMELSAQSPVIKKTILELGGKGPVIVEPDCNIDSAVQCMVLGLCSNQGQVCCATTRLYLHKDIYDVFLEKLSNAVSSLKIGDPLDPTTEMGTLISRKQREHVHEVVQAALASGARLVCGGEFYEEGSCKNGCFYRPTILDNVKQNDPWVQSEIFGPVLCVQKYENIDEAIQLANDTKFGLGANIFTSDYRTAYFAAQKINAGSVWVNMPNGSQMNCPFGGNKNSGIGREYGIDGLKEYLRIKNNMWNMRTGIFSYYD